MVDERRPTTLFFIASSLNGQTPARRKPPETAPTENDSENRSPSNFGKSIFRIVFLCVFRKYAETRHRHFFFAGLKQRRPVHYEKRVCRTPIRHITGLLSIHLLYCLVIFPTRVLFDQSEIFDNNLSKDGLRQPHSDFLKRLDQINEMIFFVNIQVGRSASAEPQERLIDMWSDGTLRHSIKLWSLDRCKCSFSHSTYCILQLLFGIVATTSFWSRHEKVYQRMLKRDQKYSTPREQWAVPQASSERTSTDYSMMLSTFFDSVIIRDEKLLHVAI